MSTGTSVLGLCFKDGVVIAADDLASYGSLARFRNVPRLMRVNENVVMGCTGDYADFQHLAKTIEGKQIDEDQWDDGNTLTPKALYTWVTRIQYNRRSKFDPLWCNWLIAGVEKDANGVIKPFLGHVDKLGTSFSDNIICTGYGSMIATPMLREAVEKAGGIDKIDEEMARRLIGQAMTLMFLRDARAWPKYHVGVVTDNKSAIEGPLEVKPDWSIAHFKDNKLLFMKGNTAAEEQTQA